MPIMGPNGQEMDPAGMTQADMGTLGPDAFAGATAGDMTSMPPDAMGGMNADMMQMMPPPAMAGMDAPMMQMMPPDAMGGMGPQHINDATSGYGWDGRSHDGGDASCSDGWYGARSHG